MLAAALLGIVVGLLRYRNGTPDPIAARIGVVRSAPWPQVARMVSARPCSGGALLANLDDTTTHHRWIACHRTGRLYGASGGSRLWSEHHHTHTVVQLFLLSTSVVGVLGAHASFHNARLAGTWNRRWRIRIRVKRIVSSAIVRRWGKDRVHGAAVHGRVYRQLVQRRILSPVRSRHYRSIHSQSGTVSV